MDSVINGVVLTEVIEFVRTKKEISSVNICIGEYSVDDLYPKSLRRMDLARRRP